MVAQLKHVRIILSQNSDRVTLLPDNQPCLLLICVAKVDAIKLKTGATHLDTGINQFLVVDVECGGFFTSRSWSPYSKWA